jgi:hypothetical protein
MLRIKLLLGFKKELIKLSKIINFINIKLSFLIYLEISKMT